MSDQIHKPGTRKKAIARATLRPGKGRVRINGKLLSTVEPVLARSKIEEPLIISGQVSKSVDIDVKVNGGGMNGQAEAVRVAISRALISFDKNLEKPFLSYDRNLLVADVRQKETHKPNRKGKARAKKPKGKR